MDPPKPGAVSVEHLAHELNSILDGAMRYLALAQGALDSAALQSPSSIGGAMTQLQAVQDGMRQMAKLLNRSMERGRVGAELFQEPTEIGHEIGALLEQVAPLAEDSRVELSCHVDERAARVPISTLGPVIVNGLRNAIQACAAQVKGHRRVELLIAIAEPDMLAIVIADTGVGVSGQARRRSRQTAGHGLGLGLSREIVNELGGRLELRDATDGPGAMLRVEIPMRSLIQHD